MRAAGARAAVWGAFALALACGGDAELLAVGTLERDRIELVAEAQEPIVEIAAREGERVEAGQLVVRLDDERLRAQLEQVESARARAEARLAELVRGPRSESIEEMRAQLAGAVSAGVTAQRDFERAQKLFAQGVISAEQIDQRRAAFDEARARRKALEAQLEALLEGTTAEELAQARAALAEAEAAVADARVRLARLAVRAPRSGQLDALPYELGERPPVGAVVAVLLADSAPYARVYVPEPLRVRVRPGEEARVRVDGVEREFAGRVRTVSSEAAFTPYFALTERDRSRLSYVAEIDLVEPEARELPSGIPLEAVFEPGALAVRETDPDE